MLRFRDSGTRPLLARGCTACISACTALGLFHPLDLSVVHPPEPAFVKELAALEATFAGEPVMTAKVAWDNASYWAITALLFFQQRYRRPEFIASIDTLMRRFFVLHARMQAFFRAWDLADDRGAYAGDAANIVDVEFLRRLQADLGAPQMNDEELRATLDANFALLEAFARAWQAIALEQHPSLARAVSDAPSDQSHLDLTALRVSCARLPA